MNCQEVRQLLSMERDGHAAGREDDAVTAHVRDCPACRQFQEAMSSARSCPTGAPGRRNQAPLRHGASSHQYYIILLAPPVLAYADICVILFLCN